MRARFVLVLVFAIIPQMGYAQTTWYVPDASFDREYADQPFRVGG